MKEKIGFKQLSSVNGKAEYDAYTHRQDEMMPFVVDLPALE